MPILPCLLNEQSHVDDFLRFNKSRAPNRHIPYWAKYVANKFNCKKLMGSFSYDVLTAKLAQDLDLMFIGRSVFPRIKE